MDPELLQVSSENQGKEVSVLGRTPESQALLSGCVLAAVLKHVVNHDLRLIKNPDVSWGWGLKTENPDPHSESTAGRSLAGTRACRQASDLCFTGHWVALLQSIWLYIG